MVHLPLITTNLPFGKNLRSFSWGSFTGELEVSLARQALSLGMRCTSISLRNKWHALVARLLQRLHAAAAAARGRSRVRQAGGGFGKNVKKQLAIDDPEGDASGACAQLLLMCGEGNTFCDEVSGDVRF